MQKAKIIKVIVGVVVGAGIIGGGYWFYNKPVTIVDKDGKSVEVKAQDYRDLRKLQSVYDVPTDIVPLIALVEDAEKLKEEQPGFFGEAENGMRVFVYPDEAILFDARAGKIAHIGDVNFDKSNVLNFAIYNGTKTDLAEKHFGNTLVTTFTDAKATVFGKAKEGYSKTVIIDLTGGKIPNFENIAKQLGATVRTLPEGEVKPEGVAALIIVGEDYANALKKK